MLLGKYITMNNYEKLMLIKAMLHELLKISGRKPGDVSKLLDEVIEDVKPVYK